PRGAGEQPAAISLRERGEERLEQLADDAVRELLLELCAAGDENLELRLPGKRSRLRDEPGLAHPGPALDQHEPAVYSRRGVHRGTPRREVVLAPQQRPARDL